MWCDQCVQRGFALLRPSDLQWSLLRLLTPLRWFTPTQEAPIGGHAPLAAGAVLLTEIAPELDMAVFDTLAGPLVVRKTQDGFTLDLPKRPRQPWDAPAELAGALGGAISGSAIAVAVEYDALSADVLPAAS